MIITGFAYYAKILGEPQPGYDKTKKEWSMDLAIDDKTRKLLAKEGLGSKIKNKGDDRGDFITFKRPAVRKDGTPSKPIRVVGPDKQPWGNALIGNGSKVNVSFLVNEVPYNNVVYKKPGILAVQVVEHVPYEGKGGDDFPEYNAETGDEEWTTGEDED